MPSAGRDGEPRVPGDEGFSPSHSVGRPSRLTASRGKPTPSGPTPETRRSTHHPRAAGPERSSSRSIPIEDSDRTLPPGAERPVSKLPDGRRLRDPRRPGRRRHGNRFQGTAGQARPVRRPQDDPGRRRRSPARSRPVRGRGPGGRRDRAPEHRPDLRDRRARRHAVLLARIPLRRQPRQE